MTDIQATDVFAYFQGMNITPEQTGIDPVLRGIMDQFAATAIGMCSFNDPSKNILRYSQGVAPKKLPWQTDDKVLAGVRASLGAAAYHDVAGEWLLAAAQVVHRDELFLLWIYRTQPPWTEAERWQWTLASQAIMRWYFEEANKSEALAIAQNRLETSASITSRLIHEFGNFLTGIMGFTELAQARAGTDTLLTMYLQEVMLSAGQGAEWIRRLHKFCQRGRGIIWPTHLVSMLQTMEARDQSKGIKQRMKIEAPADLPLVKVDTASLQSIFQELIDNAREATNGKGTLTIQAWVQEMSAADCQNLLGALAPGACVAVTVMDEGPGFSADARAKLFHEPFFSSKPRHRGTGLLAVYGTLRRLQGGLSDDFQHGGPGGCVRLYLPIAKLPVTGPASAKPAHLLLVHTDATLLESMRSVLTTSGLRVTAVNAPPAALSTYQLTKPSFNLVVTEATMPRVSGFDLARRILDHHPKAQFLFLNTQGSYHDFAEEEMLKRFMVLRWPIEAAEFVRAVENALTNPAV